MKQKGFSPLSVFVLLFLLVGAVFTSRAEAATIAINGGAAYSNSAYVTLDVATSCSATIITVSNQDGSMSLNIPSSQTGIGWTLTPTDGNKTVNVTVGCHDPYQTACGQYQCGTYACGSYCCSSGLFGCNGYCTSYCPMYCTAYCTAYHDYIDSASATITLDMTPPSVSATSPADGATNVPVSLATVTAAFSEKMDAATIDGTTFTLDNGATGTVSYDAGSDTAVLALSSSLVYSTTYTAMLSSAVKDLAGNTVLPAGYSWSFTTAAPPAPHIAVTDSVAPIDDNAVPFGDTMAGTTMDQTVTVTNSGDANLIIGVVGGSDPLVLPFIKTVDHCSGQALPPAASCALTLRFAPTMPGAFSDSFDIPSNDSAMPSVTVAVSGNGTPVPAPRIAVTDAVAPVDDHAVAFGDITVAVISDQTVTVTNSGNADLVIGNVGVADPLAAPFGIAADNCSGQTLAPADSCTMTVSFAPSGAAVFSDSFDIPSNDSAMPSVTVAVSGNGTPVPAPHIVVTDAVAPVDDHAVAFGDITVAVISDQTVTVTNSGNADLVIGDVGVANPLAAPFSITADNCSGRTLAPAAGCTVTVRFAPSITGAANDSFNIPSNDSAMPSVTVNVSGNGLAVAGNNPPSAAALVFPANGQTGVDTPVTFRWNKASDPDGDAVTYQLYTCTDQTFAGCGPTTVASLPKAGHFAGLGGYGAGLLSFGFMFAGGIKRRKKIMMLLALLIVTGTLVISCGGGGGSAPAAGPPPAVEVTSPPQAFAAGTTYYWKVVAVDSKGSATSSAVWSFVTR